MVGVKDERARIASAKSGRMMMSTDGVPARVPGWMTERMSEVRGKKGPEKVRPFTMHHVRMDGSPPAGTELDKNEGEGEAKNETPKGHPPL